MVCRLHALLAELVPPGEIAKELYGDAEVLGQHRASRPPSSRSATTWPLSSSTTCADSTPQTKESHRRIRLAVKASGTSLTEIYGVGPIIAAQLIGYTGDVRRFAAAMPSPLTTGRHRSSSPRAAESSTASPTRGKPSSSTTPCTWLPSPRSAIPGTEGRIYFERKVAEGKTKKEALRSLKRQISNAVYRQLLLDAR